MHEAERGRRSAKGAEARGPAAAASATSVAPAAPGAGTGREGETEGVVEEKRGQSHRIKAKSTPKIRQSASLILR